MKAPSEEIYIKSMQGTVENRFSGLQRCRWQYVSNLIRLAVVVPQNLRNPAKFSENSDL